MVCRIYWKEELSLLLLVFEDKTKKPQISCDVYKYVINMDWNCAVTSYLFSLLCDSFCLTIRCLMLFCPHVQISLFNNSKLRTHLNCEFLDFDCNSHFMVLVVSKVCFHFILLLEYSRLFHLLPVTITCMPYMNSMPFGSDNMAKILNIWLPKGSFMSA